MKTLRLDRGEFAYFERGEGSLVLALHGFPDSPHGLLPLVERLSTKHRVIAPFLRGYAPSVTSGPFDLDTLVDDVLAIGSAFAARFAIVGHDWGAAITYGAIARADTPVSAAVTLSVPHPVPFVQALVRDPAQLARSRYMALFQLGAIADRLVQRDDYAYINALWKRWSPALGAHSAIVDAKAAIAPGFPAALEYYRAFARSPLKLRALAKARITVPTLHLTGRDDGCIGHDVGRDELRFFRGPFAREVIDDAGHFLALEKPDVIAQRALAWLAHHRA